MADIKKNIRNLDVKKKETIGVRTKSYTVKNKPLKKSDFPGGEAAGKRISYNKFSLRNHKIYRNSRNTYSYSSNNNNNTNDNSSAYASDKIYEGIQDASDYTISGTKRAADYSKGKFRKDRNIKTKSSYNSKDEVSYGGGEKSPHGQLIKRKENYIHNDIKTKESWRGKTGGLRNDNYINRADSTKLFSEGPKVGAPHGQGIGTSSMAIGRNMHSISFDVSPDIHKRGRDLFRRKQKEKMTSGSKTGGSVIKRGLRNASKGVLSSIKGTIASSKTLMNLLMAGGSASIVIIMICVLFGAAFNIFGDASSSSYTPVSAEVEAYSPLITQYAKVHGISEYTELIKAVMMQESGGKGKDPMQCAESGYNTKYPREPNGITDPEYSIDIGVKTLAGVIKEAEVESPIDMDRIRLALQGYNYGNGYIAWAIKRDGGYTVENASAFSDEQASKHGWSGYGDKQYPSHVLRYYPYGNIIRGVGNSVIVNVAVEQIGNPGGKKFWSWYGFNSRVDWCCIFVSWCADQCGYLKTDTLPRFSVVSDGVTWFKNRNEWQYRRGYTPMPGDIIFFDWGANGTQDHVGIVESCDGTYVYTIEGNTSDQCARRTYSVDSAEIIGYGVPKY